MVFNYASLTNELWASLVAQLVENLPARQETLVWFLGRKDPLEEGMTTYFSILAWRIPMDRGAWRVTVHGVTKSRTWQSDWVQHNKLIYQITGGLQVFFKVKCHIYYSRHVLLSHLTCVKLCYVYQVPIFIWNMSLMMLWALSPWLIFLISPALCFYVFKYSCACRGVFRNIYVLLQHTGSTATQG